MREFKGRVIIPGTAEAEALVSGTEVDFTESYKKALKTPDGTTLCAHKGNKDIYGKPMAGMALCIPRTSSAEEEGITLYNACVMEYSPACILMAESIDAFAASGAILADVWAEGVSMPVIDNLGYEFLDFVKDGMTIRVKEDGVVEVDEETEITSYQKIKKQRKKSILIYAVSLIVAIAVAGSLYVFRYRPMYDIMDYINNDRKEINELHTQILDTMYSGKYKTAEEYKNFYKKEAIPTYEQILRKCGEIEYRTKEVAKLHSLYIKSVEKDIEALEYLVEGIEKNDRELLKKSVAADDKSEKYMDDFGKLKRQYGKKYGLTTSKDK